MARCTCGSTDTAPLTCTCLIEADPNGNLSVTGSGSVADPYVVRRENTFLNRYVLTASTSLDLSIFPEAKWAHVMLVGGGGGSASTGPTIAGQGIARGGGAGGTYTEVWLSVAALTSPVAVTIGAGGVAGTPGTTATAGGNGGDTTFGPYAMATGGGGSPATQAPSTNPVQSAGGTPGAATGLLSIPGAPGDVGRYFTTNSKFGGAGGAPASLGVASGTGFGGIGMPGKIYGGGAAGSSQEGAVAGTVGAAGAPGVVIVELFS